MRPRTVVVSAVLVLSAGLTATACSSPDGGPRGGGTSTTAADPCATARGDAPECEVEMPSGLEIGEAKPASRAPRPDFSGSTASPSGEAKAVPDPGFVTIQEGEPAGPPETQGR